MKSDKSMSILLGGCLGAIIAAVVLNLLMALALVFVLGFFGVHIPLSVVFVGLFITSLAWNGMKSKA